MADREMIAATLAAALLTGRGVGPHSNPAGYAVMVYQQVLSALDGASASASATVPSRPSPSPTP